MEDPFEAVRKSSKEADELSDELVLLVGKLSDDALKDLAKQFNHKEAAVNLEVSIEPLKTGLALLQKISPDDKVLEFWKEVEEQLRKTQNFINSFTADYWRENTEEKTVIGFDIMEGWVTAVVQHEGKNHGKVVSKRPWQEGDPCNDCKATQTVALGDVLFCEGCKEEYVIPDEYHLERALKEVEARRPDLIERIAQRKEELGLS